jgi:hypothetical protein
LHRQKSRAAFGDLKQGPTLRNRRVSRYRHKGRSTKHGTDDAAKRLFRIPFHHGTLYGLGIVIARFGFAGDRAADKIY